MPKIHATQKKLSERRRLRILRTVFGKLWNELVAKRGISEARLVAGTFKGANYTMADAVKLCNTKAKIAEFVERMGEYMLSCDPPRTCRSLVRLSRPSIFHSAEVQVREYMNSFQLPPCPENPSKPCGYKWYGDLPPEFGLDTRNDTCHSCGNPLRPKGMVLTLPQCVHKFQSLYGPLLDDREGVEYSVLKIMCECFGAPIMLQNKQWMWTRFEPVE